MTPTVSRKTYRRRVAAVNALAGAAEALHLDLGHIHVGSILDAAQRSTGLDDWGGDHFLTPMRKVADAVRAEEDFTPLARVILRQSWTQAVMNRLHLKRYLDQHPHVRDVQVKRPIFVLGFPRTGTTLLQHLLALDPRRRGLQFWELTHPVPHVDSFERERRDRIRMVDWMLRAAYQVAPEMGQVHYVDATTLEECWYLFANSFAVMNWDLQSGLVDYGDWLSEQWDMHAAYADYKTLLQLRLSRLPAEQLVLKCPEHLWFIDTLLDTFPDACIVWTHRDPYPTIASYCSLMSMQWRTLFGRIHGARIGRHMEMRLLQGIERALAARAKADPARFYDVRFSELVADPVAVTRDIHRHFGLDWSDGADAAARDYLGQKREDDRGKHKYDPATYGLDRDRVSKKYASYIERFGVEIAGSR